MHWNTNSAIIWIYEQLKPQLKPIGKRRAKPVYFYGQYVHLNETSDYLMLKYTLEYNILVPFRAVRFIRFLCLVRARPVQKRKKKVFSVFFTAIMQEAMTKEPLLFLGIFQILFRRSKRKKYEVKKKMCGNVNPNLTLITAMKNSNNAEDDG